MAGSPRLTINGKTLTRRVWALLGDAKHAADIPDGAARVVQGSWSGNVRASAGTHNGGGAFDLSVAGLSRDKQLRLVHELRRRNVAAWLRSPEFGWPSRLGMAHIHGIVRDDPGLSWGARSQAIAYRLGRNGLASRRKDPHPRPAAYPFVMPGDARLADLKYGKRNGSVRALQKALRIAEDAWYGPATDRAVREHQRRHGLAVDPAGKSFVGPVQARLLGLT